MATKPRILSLDIECTPIKGWVWGPYEQNLIRTIQDWYMLSFAYKWVDEKTTHVKALPDYKGYKKGSCNDRALVTDLAELFNQADIIIAHNGDAFDIKKSNARFLAHGIPVPSHYRTIDTLKVARKHFKMTYNKLDTLGEYLGVGKKLPHAGFDLWEGCMNGDPNSWKTMKAYNKQDVVLLEEVYLKLRPWIDNHPNLLTFSEEETVGCTNCASTDLVSHGFRFAQGTKYRRLQCGECGAWVKQSISGKGKISNK